MYQVIVLRWVNGRAHRGSVWVTEHPRERRQWIRLSDRFGVIVMEVR